MPTIAIACSVTESPPSIVAPSKVQNEVQEATTAALPKSEAAVMRLDLSHYLWENRLLLVFAPSETTPAYQQQMQIFADMQAGFVDRDLYSTSGAQRLLPCWDSHALVQACKDI